MVNGPITGPRLDDVLIGWLAVEDRVAGAEVGVDAAVNDARIAADAKLLRGDDAGGVSGAVPPHGDAAGGLAAEVGMELDKSPERNVR